MLERGVHEGGRRCSHGATIVIKSVLGVLFLVVLSCMLYFSGSVTAPSYVDIQVPHRRHGSLDVLGYFIGASGRRDYPQQNVSEVVDIFPPSFPKTGLLEDHPKSDSGESCCELTAGLALELLCGDMSVDSHKPRINDSFWSDQKSLYGCNCEDLLLCRLVMVTAFSSNHFLEATDMIASVQKHLPHTKIIAFDLGLNIRERTIVTTYCSVELRKFNFTKYPSHVKTLTKFAWKPLMIKEIAEEYEVVLYGDTSLRVVNTVKDSILKFLLQFPYFSCPVHQFPAISITHNGMLDYFNFNLSRKEAVKSIPDSIPATCFLMWLNSQMCHKFLTQWVDCALHETCISPRGAKRSLCNIHKLRSGDFAECHRFDQSALNIILIQQFSLKTWNQIKYPKFQRTHHVLSIYRHSTHFHDVMKC